MHVESDLFVGYNPNQTQHPGGATMTPYQVRETFRKAVQTLVDENEKVKERLLIAYASQLSLVRSTDPMPPEVADELRRLRYALSDAEMPYGYGERAARKLRDMSDEEASELARTIFSMYLQLCELEFAVLD
jgi:hypothetical protein